MKNKYLKDPLWYLAILLAVLTWFLIDIFVQPAVPRNLFITPHVILISIILYPVLEEIVFRGLIQGMLLQRVGFRELYWGFTGANILTSVLFSALHLIHQPLFMAVLIFFPSIIFGYFRDRYKSVYPSIYLHSFYNAGFSTLFVAI